MFVVFFFLLFLLFFFLEFINGWASLSQFVSSRAILIFDVFFYFIIFIIITG